MKRSSQTLLRVLLAAFAVALPIASAEFFLRTRFAETPYVPGSRLLKVQSYLRLHPTLGFLWKGDIAYDVYNLSDGATAFIAYERDRVAWVEAEKNGKRKPFKWMGF